MAGTLVLPGTSRPVLSVPVWKPQEKHTKMDAVFRPEVSTVGNTASPKPPEYSGTAQFRAGLFDLGLVQRKLAIIGILLTLGFPYFALLLISFVTHPPKYHFRIAVSLRRWRR